MLEIGADLLAAVADAAEAAFPDEGCGLLVGSGRRIVRVTEVVTAPNLRRGEASDRFELDPRIRFATERRLRGGDLRIVGHWHSHPDGSARPSASDLAEAWEPDLVWLIVGVTIGFTGQAQAIQILAHRLDRVAGRSHPVPLRLPEKSACNTRGFRG